MKNVVNKIDFTLEILPKEYSLTITFGEGQPGNSALKNFDGKYQTGSINNLLLGKGKSIKGKKLLISSIVTDANENTNHTSVTYTINGNEIKTFEDDVDTDNSSIYYTTTINFI
ncbi:MAG: hypothetical protein WCX31_12940 [Salinivirgaceae bacterium]